MSPLGSSLAPDHRGTSAAAVADALDAVREVRSGDRVFVQSASAYPQRLIDVLLARVVLDPDLGDIEMIHLHTNGRALYADPAFHGKVRHRALFVGPNVRSGLECGQVCYCPVFLSDVPALIRSHRLKVDVALLHVSPPDEHGFCSLGTSVDCALAAIDVARVRIAQVNPQMPRTLGESFVHVSQLDRIVEVDDSLPAMTVRPPGDVEHEIARYVASIIPDGATLQVGIGAVPDAVLSALSGHRDLGIHSEVISDGVMDLIDKGVITGANKAIDRHKVACTFLYGSSALYAFAHDNPVIEMRPADYTNAVRVIAGLDGIVAINSAIEVDLSGQVCAEAIGPRMYSGVGGQMDFMEGAALAHQGKPVIALPSTATGGTVSRIVPALSAGSAVTSTRANVHYLATEYGIVNLHGLDLRERAEALISIAHPKFRPSLSAMRFPRRSEQGAAADRRGDLRVPI
jgi:acyl-CoA hydrolase